MIHGEDEVFGFVDALIITALRDELDAIYDTEAEFTGRLDTPWLFKSTEQKIPYNIARFKSNVGGNLRVFTIAIASPLLMGTRETAFFTAALATALNPRVLAMCGVCAGKKDKTKLGDIIVGRESWILDERKKRSDGNEEEITGQVRSSAANRELVEMALYLSKNHPYEVFSPNLKMPGRRKAKVAPNVIDGVIYTVDEVVKSISPFKDTAKSGRKTVAKEMETFAVLEIGKILQIPTIVIKGVQDFGDLEKNDRFRSYCASASAYLALASIKQYLRIHKPTVHELAASMNVSTRTVPNIVLRGQHVEVLADKKLTITSDVFIEEGGTLTIRGTDRVVVTEGKQILARGCLIIEGVSPLRLTTIVSEKGKWGGICLTGRGTSGSRLKHLKIMNGSGAKIIRQDPTRSLNSEGYSSASYQIVNINSFNSNHHTMGGAVSIFDTRDIEIEACEFSENSANEGGAIAAKSVRRLILNNCKFLKNHAGGTGIMRAPGGAIYFQNCFDTTIRNTDFIKNAATDTFSCGGAIYAGFNCKIGLHDCRFEDNHSQNAGGAIYALCLPMTVGYSKIDSQTDLELINISSKGDYVEKTTFLECGHAFHFDTGTSVRMANVVAQTVTSKTYPLCLTSDSRDDFKSSSSGGKVHIYGDHGFVAAGAWKGTHYKDDGATLTGLEPKLRS